MLWEIKFVNDINKTIFFTNYKLRLFTKTLIFSVLLIGHLSFFCIGSEQIKPLDFSGDGPIFLSKKQIREDLKEASRLFRENYVRHSIFEKNGVDWEGVFKKLESLLLKDIKYYTI